MTVEVRFLGHLGNNLFQYALGRVLAEELGHALVCTSVHGTDVLMDHASDPEQIEEQLGHHVNLVIDSGLGGLEGSTVVDLSEPEPRILREGKGPIEDLF